MDDVQILGVCAMADAVGLCRDRFYDLVKAGVFPPPAYLLRTRRPVYVAEMQRMCLEIRQCGVGFNGHLVTFNQTGRSRRLRMTPLRRSDAPPGRKSIAAVRDEPRRLLAKLHSLGLAGVNPDMLASAVERCFSTGVQGLDEGTVLTTLVRHFRQTDSE
jgi:hypothetical protein